MISPLHWIRLHHSFVLVPAVPALGSSFLAVPGNSPAGFVVISQAYTADLVSPQGC